MEVINIKFIHSENHQIGEYLNFFNNFYGTNLISCQYVDIESPLIENLNLGIVINCLSISHLQNLPNLQYLHIEVERRDDIDDNGWNHFQKVIVSLPTLQYIFVSDFLTNKPVEFDSNPIWIQRKKIIEKQNIILVRETNIHEEIKLSMLFKLQTQNKWRLHIEF